MNTKRLPSFLLPNLPFRTTRTRNFNPVAIFRRLLLSVTFLLTAWSASAQTLVSGQADGIWDPSGNPYILTDNTSVPSGRSLSIRPGVEIILAAGVQLDVSGVIHAEGMSGSPVVFKGANPSNYWSRIRVLASGSTFKHCVFRDATNPIYFYVRSEGSPRLELDVAQSEFSNFVEMAIGAQSIGTVHSGHLTPIVAAFRSSI